LAMGTHWVLIKCNSAMRPGTVATPVRDRASVARYLIATTVRYATYPAASLELRSRF